MSCRLATVMQKKLPEQKFFAEEGETFSRKFEIGKTRLLVIVLSDDLTSFFYLCPMLRAGPPPPSLDLEGVAFFIRSPFCNPRGKGRDETRENSPHSLTHSQE